MPEYNVIPIHNETHTGNLKPLVYEIRHALEQLLKTGEKTVIDLSAMPISDDELLALEQFLGKGEVSAELDILGKSRVEETRFSGVWLVRHLDEAGEKDRLFIEIDTVPPLLCAQTEDIHHGLSQLVQSLTEDLSENRQVEIKS